MEKIVINDWLYFAEPAEQDIPFFVSHFRDKTISDNTLNIPFPYREEDGHWYVNRCREEKKQFGHVLSFVIRNTADELVGAAVFHGKNTHPALRHRDEIGYWVAADQRKKGVMAAALPVLIAYGWEVRGLEKIDAPVFATNHISENLLLKLGFVQEAYYKNAYFKNGSFIDAKLFSLLKK